MAEANRRLLERLRLLDCPPLGTTSSSPYTGSPTFDEVPFHVHFERKPTISTYVVIMRGAEPVAHYGRIATGSEENPRADPIALQQNASYGVGRKDPRPNDRSPHVTRTMAVEVLGEIHLGDDDTLTVKEPGQLPMTGQPVFELPASTIPWLLNLPGDPDHGLHIGTIESGSSSVDFYLPMEAIARHIAVAGKTGVGKSYAVGVLIEELVRHRIPVISFDVLGDVTNAAEDLHGANYRAGHDFRVPYSVIGLSEFLSFIPNLTREQSELVALAYDRIYSKALNTLDDDGEVAVPLDRLTDEIEAAGIQFGQEPVAKRAAQRVRAAVGRKTLLTTQTEPWLKEFADKPLMNVAVGHLGQNDRNLVVGAGARMLQILRRRDRVPPFVFVLDEAHLFLPSAEHTSSTPVLREIVRTARHDAIGLVLLTQSPASMDKQVLLTCNTRLVFALDQEDLRLVSGTMGDLSEQTVARIPKMAKGTTIVSSGIDIMRHPAMIRVRKRRTREGAPTPNLAEEVKRWRARKNS